MGSAPSTPAPGRPLELYLNPIAWARVIDGLVAYERHGHWDDPLCHEKHRELVSSGFLPCGQAWHAHL